MFMSIYLFFVVLRGMRYASTFVMIYNSVSVMAARWLIIASVNSSQGRVPATERAPVACCCHMLYIWVPRSHARSSRNTGTDTHTQGRRRRDRTNKWGGQQAKSTPPATKDLLSPGISLPDECACILNGVDRKSEFVTPVYQKPR